jgi:hypothetical protein
VGLEGAAEADQDQEQQEDEPESDGDEVHTPLAGYPAKRCRR